MRPETTRRWLVLITALLVALGPPTRAHADDRIEDLLEAHLGASYVELYGYRGSPSQWNVFLDGDLRYPLLSQLIAHHPWFAFRDGITGHLAGSPLLHFHVDPAAGVGASYEALAGVHGCTWAWLVGARAEATLFFMKPFDVIQSATAVAVTTLDIVPLLRLDAWGSPLFGGTYGGEVTFVTEPHHETGAAMGIFVRVARAPAHVLASPTDFDGALWSGVVGIRLFRFAAP